MSTSSSKSSLINSIRRLRDWEQKNLPIYGTDAGYALFLNLATFDEMAEINLKSLYLSMPYAESTIRLLFRNLEEDGWIELPRQQGDHRFRSFVPTDKFITLVDQWLDELNECFKTK